MAAEAWRGDACSLVDAFRAGRLSPREALEGSLAAIEASDLNAFTMIDADAARGTADAADVSRPFGGVPVGVKVLDPVAGWPATFASLVFKDDVSSFDSTQVARVRSAGAVLVGQTTASEFGFINCTNTRLYGATHNPWRPGRTPGGSSGGSAAAVAGGLVPLASGGDGGGSLRIPAGFTGLFSLKSTFGRIPKGPMAVQPPLTVVTGCLSRSVRDTARWFDVCNGFDARDTLSLPRVEGWERGLGTHDLAGRRAAVAMDFGGAIVEPRMARLLTERAEALIAACGMTRVEVDTSLPDGSAEWAVSNLSLAFGLLGDRYPACHDDLTGEMQFFLDYAREVYSIELVGRAEVFRVLYNERMADLFDRVDVVFTASNPDVAFSAEGPMATTVGDVDLVATYGLERALGNNGALTFPANLSGNPAVSIPSGDIDGLPVGLQVVGRHHEDPLLLDLAWRAEREFPWPLTAP